MKILLPLLLLTTLSFGQKINGNYFTTSLKNGAFVNKEVVFLVSDVGNIDTSLVYKTWADKTYNNPENEQWIKDNSSFSKLEMFLNSRAMMTVLIGQMKLKNATSLDFIEGSTGQMYLSSSGTFNTTVPIQADNGYGNPIKAKIYGTCTVKEDGVSDSVMLD